jgi:hypothetical protein
LVAPGNSEYLSPRHAHHPRWLLFLEAGMFLGFDFPDRIRLPDSDCYYCWSEHLSPQPPFVHGNDRLLADWVQLRFDAALFFGWNLSDCSPLLLSLRRLHSALEAI